MMSKNKAKSAFLILLFLLSVNLVYAQGLSDALLRINSFFERGGNSSYNTLIDFMLFFLIGLSAMMIGVKAIFPDQMRQGKMIAIVIALIFTVALIRAGVSVLSLLPYVGYIVFLGLVVIVYLILVAMGILKEKRILCFLLSSLIAFIIFVLLGWVFDADAVTLWEAFKGTIDSMIKPVE